ncbi:MAG: tetratricopeptide repeat protein, partial [Candidatus Thermoplasmatota archaeon]|nr:tetratricopeptide repeat protein [Candidatus Thermoplasmatota archaeon]
MDKTLIMKAAREAIDNKNYDEAIEILEEILQESVDIDALELKGEAFRLKGEPKEAMKCYDRALVVDLNQKAIWKGKGICLLAVGRDNEARRSFDRVVKIDPDYADGWLERGRMGMKVHDWEMALESFEKVTKLDPLSHLGWYNRANALITGYGKMEEAIK